MTEQKNKIRKRTFVIGAGMSAECGTPVISQFLQPTFTDLVKGKRLNLLLKFISAVYPKGATPNIEEVFSLVDYAIAKKEPLAGIDSYNLQKVRVALIYLISEILAKSSWDRLNKEFDQLDNPYAMLLSKQDKRLQGKHLERADRDIMFMIDNMANSTNGTLKLSPEAKGWLGTYGLLAYILHFRKDTVITLNYDLFLDLALSMPKPKWNIDYGTDFLELEPDVPNTDIERMVLIYNHRPDYDIVKKIITVLKLHGALNWAVCSSCKEMFATVLTPLSRVNRYIRELQNNPLDLRKDYLCCPDFSPESLIVPPTWMKDYDNRYLANIWGTATRHLAKTDMIIFLGYSFSESDYQIRYLFNKALRMRAGTPWAKIVIVNRNIDRVLPIYERFFGKVEPFKGKVSEYLHQIVENEKEAEG